MFQLWSGGSAPEEKLAAVNDNDVTGEREINVSLSLRVMRR